MPAPRPPGPATPIATRVWTIPERLEQPAGPAYANRKPGSGPSRSGWRSRGAGYANRNQYDQYHPGMGYGNYGNYGGWGMRRRLGYGGYGAGVGAWGMGSPMYGWGMSNYNNAYYGLPQMALDRLPLRHRRALPIGTTTPSRSARPPRHPRRMSPTRPARSSTRLATPSSRVTMPRPSSLTSRRSARRPTTRRCTSSWRWGSSRKASTTRPRRRSSRSCRSARAGTGRP